MTEHRHTNTRFYNTSTEYDSCGLGRDDPIWTRYVSEAKKWDARLVEEWHSFLIESYKLLQVDKEEIIASGIPAMVALLEAMALNQTPPNILHATDPSANFKPTRAAVAINAAWFLALTLGMSAALLAMLVKRWAEGYQNGYDLSSPCVQARARQARYDKLKGWGTEDIALALPALLMHTALGLFLIGLVLFLYQLDHIVLSLVLIVVVFTFAVYFGTTLAPLFIAFCPFDTPLSSRKYLVFLCELVRAIIYYLFSGVDGKKPNQISTWLRCQQVERTISESTIPDELTARALEWLIGYSQEKESIDIAIRAIAGAVRGVQIYSYRSQNSLIRLLAQRFIAIWNTGLGERTHTRNFITPDNIRLEEAAICARALENIVRHIRMQHLSYGGISGYAALNYPESQPTDIIVIEDQVRTVERGLLLISSSETPYIAISGLTCLSAWYTSTNRTIQSRDNWKSMIARLIASLSGTHHDRRSTGSADSDTSQHGQTVREGTTQDDHQASMTILETDMINRIVDALLVEIAHWRWDLSKQERQEVLNPLINLFASPLLDGPARPGMLSILAVLAILFHDHQEFSAELEALPQADGNWIEVLDPGNGPEDVDDSLFMGQSSSKDNPGNIQSSSSSRRSFLAQHTARICQESEEHMRKHTDALLLFGLVGLLDSISVHGLTENVPQIMGIVTTQLKTLSDALQSGPILLPGIFSSTLDTRAIMADAITRSLSPSPFKGQLHPLPDEEKAALLECLGDNGYLWYEYGHQFLMSMVQLLHSTQSMRLKEHCLIALNKYFSAHSGHNHSSPYQAVDWQFLFSLDVPYKLVEIMKDIESLRPKAVTTFDLIMQMIPQYGPNLEVDVQNQISVALSRLAIGDLLSTFAEAVLCRYGHQHVKPWKELLTNLPTWLDSTEGLDSELITQKLRHFCSENVQPGQMTILTLGLRDKLNEKSERP